MKIVYVNHITKQEITIAENIPNEYYGNLLLEPLLKNHKSFGDDTYLLTEDDAKFFLKACEEV